MPLPHYESQNHHPTVSNNNHKSRILRGRTVVNKDLQSWKFNCFDITLGCLYWLPWPSANLLILLWRHLWNSGFCYKILQNIPFTTIKIKGRCLISACQPNLNTWVRPSKSSVSTFLLFKKKRGEGAEEISQKNTCCSCSSREFSSQHNLNGSQLLITPVPKTLVPSSTFCRHMNPHAAHMAMRAHMQQKPDKSTEYSRLGGCSSGLHHCSPLNIIFFPSFTSFTVFYLNQSNIEFNETESYNTQALGKYSQDQEANKNDNAIFPPIHSPVSSSSWHSVTTKKYKMSLEQI